MDLFCRANMAKLNDHLAEFFQRLLTGNQRQKHTFRPPRRQPSLNAAQILPVLPIRIHFQISPASQPIPHPKTHSLNAEPTRKFST